MYRTNEVLGTLGYDQMTTAIHINARRAFEALAAAVRLDVYVPHIPVIASDEAVEFFPATAFLTQKVGGLPRRIDTMSGFEPGDAILLRPSQVNNEVSVFHGNGDGQRHYMDFWVDPIRTNTLNRTLGGIITASQRIGLQPSLSALSA